MEAKNIIIHIPEITMTMTPTHCIILYVMVTYLLSLIFLRYFRDKMNNHSDTMLAGALSFFFAPVFIPIYLTLLLIYLIWIIVCKIVGVKL